MIVSRLKLKNWRNFREVDVRLRERQFIVGPNASGKSNLLDVFRFLRDIAKTTGGGLQKAIKDRGGISKVRCLSARRPPEILIGIEIAESADDKIPKWKYEIGIRQETSGRRRPILASEQVWKGEEEIIKRPNDRDKDDRARLTQTFLEQVNENRDFREIAEFLEKTTYLHLVPQLLRYAQNFQNNLIENDPFGQGFLEQVANTNSRTQKSRLSRIEKVIKIAVPKLKDLRFERDEATGRPHLKALYSHWRPDAGWQREDQFSDGTLRLMGFLWSLLEGNALLLLEEPELNLHAGIVEKLAPFIYRMQRKEKQKGRRQVLISTHSSELLSDKEIDGREVLLLIPDNEGTKVVISSDLPDVKSLLVSGVCSVGEAVIPRTIPEQFSQLDMFP